MMYYCNLVPLPAGGDTLYFSELWVFYVNVWGTSGFELECHIRVVILYFNVTITHVTHQVSLFIRQTGSCCFCWKQKMDRFWPKETKQNPLFHAKPSWQKKTFHLGGKHITMATHTLFCNSPFVKIRERLIFDVPHTRRWTKPAFLCPTLWRSS